MVGIGVGLPAGLAALTSVITALTVSVGLSFLGWLVGLVCGVVLAACVRLGLGRSGTTTLGPADLVTLVRATLACGVAALVADSFAHAARRGRHRRALGARAGARRRGRVGRPAHAHRRRPSEPGSTGRWTRS